MPSPCIVCCSHLMVPSITISSGHLLPFIINLALPLQTLPLARLAACSWKYFCSTGTYSFEAWLSFHSITCSTWCNRCPVGVEQCMCLVGGTSEGCSGETQSMKGSLLNSSSSCVEGIQACIYVKLKLIQL